MSNRNSYDSHNNMSFNPGNGGGGSAQQQLKSNPPPVILHPGHHHDHSHHRLSVSQRQALASQPAGSRLSSDNDTTKIYTSEQAAPPSCIEYVAILLSYLLTIIFFPFAVCSCYKVVREYQRAVIFRMGRLRDGGARGPGTFFILPCVDECYILDLRTVTFDVPPQEILTHDAVTVAVDAVG